MTLTNTSWPKSYLSIKNMDDIDLFKKSLGLSILSYNNIFPQIYAGKAADRALLWSFTFDVMLQHDNDICLNAYFCHHHHHHHHYL